MNKLTIGQFKNKNPNAKNFIAKYQYEIMKDKVFPKFINSFNGKQKKLWQSVINRLIPNRNFKFNNEDDYLRDNKTTKDEVIINSIKYCLPNITKEDTNYLHEYFSIFTKINYIARNRLEKRGILFSS